MGKELTETLKGYNPEIIDNGDKFEDNIEIVEKFLNLEETKQVLLTNGEFIEKEIMGGLEPILFTGRQNVPDKIQTYLKNSPIEIGVLIGNELMSAATNIRRSTGIAVMVKFARGARSSGEGVSAVEGLDLFPVPKPTLSLNVESIKYNLLTNELEVTYRSDSNVPVYLRGTITINDGKETTRLGDTDSIFISPGNYKTISYALEIENSNGLNANVYTLFGETPTSMDYVFEAEYDVEAIEVLDRCEVEVLSTKYNKQSQEFIINVKNLAEVDCWSSLEIEDVSIGGKEMTLATENPVKISQKSSRKMIIKEELAEEDIEDNAFVNVVARYGERQTSLIKVFNGNFKLEIAVLTAMTYLAILALIVIAVLIFFYIKNKKEEEKGY